jgi:hypothetical protein
MAAQKWLQAHYDRVIVVALFVAVVCYLAALPRYLGPADESFFLYEARRICEGDVMYRDFFQFVAPAAWYAMAGLFWIFGTSMATARISMAVLHAGTAVLLYLTCRRIGVRQVLAVLPPLAYVALCEPPWPHASPHWVSTFLVVLLLWMTLARRTDDTRVVSLRALALRLGLVAGVLITVQQQKGAIVAAGIAALLLVDPLVDARYDRRGFRLAHSALCSFLAGLAAIVVPVTIVIVLVAGWEPVFEDLVHYPLREYRGAIGVSWGAVGPLSVSYARYTWPVVLRYLPLVMVPAVLRAAIHLLRRTDRQRLRTLAILLVFCAFSILSTAYNDDFIHLAYIAPVFFVAIAESAEWALDQLRPALVARLAGWSVALVLALPLADKVLDNTRRFRAEFPLHHQTAFGAIDFAAQWEVALVDTVRDRLRSADSNEIFCYPIVVSPYLTTGGHNPTPFQLLAPGHSQPGWIQQALTILQTQRPPIIVAAPLALSADDPIAEFIDEQYQFTPLPDVPLLTPGLAVFERKDLLSPAADESQK